VGLITSQYEHALQDVYYDIGNRGIRVDTPEIKKSLAIVNAEIARNLAICSKQWACRVYIGAENKTEDAVDEEWSVNLNASNGKHTFLKKLQELGYEVPKVAKKNEDGEYESEYSAGELSLQKMLAANQFGYPGGDPAIKAVLKVKEYGTLKSRYLYARLFNRAGLAYYLCNYNVAGTLTGRRGSRKHTFGFGNNAQNFPKHSDIAFLFRKCLIARPGNIFLMVDQMQAEDWPVSALANNLRALDELRQGIDRHTNLASAIFNIPVPTRTKQEWKDSMERYLGKKTRHASNYEMGPGRMSDALAQEGYSYSTKECKVLLDRVAQIDPNVKLVFHRYVQDCVSKTRILRTPEPFARERQFLSARPNDFNSSVFKEAYAYIPQSTVGDNTGVAVLDMEASYPQEERFIVQEGHDSIVQDVEDKPETIYRQLMRVDKAFDREITFHNGIKLKIPIEAELGYDFNTSVKIKDFSLQAICEAREQLQEKLKKLAA
jgi:hypothetical protein